MAALRLCLIVAALKPVHGKVAGTSEAIQDRDPSRRERLQALESLLHRRLGLTERPLLRRILRSAADCTDQQQRPTSAQKWRTGAVPLSLPELMEAAPVGRGEASRAVRPRILRRTNMESR